VYNDVNIIADFIKDKENAIKSASDKKHSIIVLNVNQELINDFQNPEYSANILNLKSGKTHFFDIFKYMYQPIDVLNTADIIMKNSRNKLPNDEFPLRMTKALLQCLLFYVKGNANNEEFKLNYLNSISNINSLNEKIEELRKTNPNDYSVKEWDNIQTGAGDSLVQIFDYVNLIIMSLINLEKNSIDNFNFAKLRNEKTILFVLNSEDEVVNKLFEYLMFSFLINSFIYEGAKNENFCKNIMMEPEQLKKFGLDIAKEFKSRKYEYAPILNDYNVGKFRQILSSAALLNNENNLKIFESKFSSIIEKAKPQIVEFLNAELDKNLGLSSSKIEDLVQKSIKKVFFEYAFDLSIKGREEEQLSRALFECIALVCEEYIRLDLSSELRRTQLYKKPVEKARILHDNKEWIFGELVKNVWE